MADLKGKLKDVFSFEEKELPHDGSVRPDEGGGVANPEHPDQHSTTGTTENEEYVGAVSGQDVGYAGETGGERRAEAERQQDES